MGYFSRTKKSCISVFYIRTKFQSSPYNNKHFRILGGTIPLNGRVKNGTGANGWFQTGTGKILIPKQLS